MNAIEGPWGSDWEVGAEIGGGGQGTTFHVTHRSDGKRGVIKLLRYQDNPEARRRMFREVANLKTLDNVKCKTPHIIEHNTDQFENIDVPLYFVMEHIEGESLSACVQRLKSLSFEQSVGLVSDICTTFRIAMGESVLHRDLKPENIIVRSLAPPDAVIVDYGLSFNHKEDDALTRTSETLDNKFLSLPERRVPGGDRRDPRSDLTGICAILFYCLIGEPPVDLIDANNRPPHRRPGRLVKEKLGDNPRTLQIDLIFDRAFAPSIDNRFQSIDEILERIAALSRPVSNAPTEEPSAVAQRYGTLFFQHDRKTQLAAYQTIATQVHKELQRLFSIHARNIAPFRIGFANLPHNFPHPPETELLGLTMGTEIGVIHNKQRVRFTYEIAARGAQGGVFRIIERVHPPGYNLWKVLEDWSVVMWYDALIVPNFSPLQSDYKECLVKAMGIIGEAVINPEKPEVVS